MSKLRIAIIGLGPAAEPHAKSLIDLKDSIETVACSARGEARAAAFKSKFNLPATTDVDGVIADASIQAVLVLTPPNTHLEVAGRCLAAGKHVLVEKPLEVSARRGRELVDAAQRSGRTLGVVLQHRIRPGAVRLRQALAAGELGEIVSASMRVAWWRPQSYYDEPGRGTLARDGGGVLLTQAIHTLDLFRSLVGVSRVVAAQASTTALHRMETEDHAAALIRLGNGAPGEIMATTAAYPGEPERIDIIGTHGGASLIGGRLKLSVIGGREEIIEAEGRSGSGASIMDFPHDAHRALIADFAEAIAAGRPPLVTGEEALASQMLIDDILNAAIKI